MVTQDRIRTQCASFNCARSDRVISCGQHVEALPRAIVMHGRSSAVPVAAPSQLAPTSLTRGAQIGVVEDEVARAASVAVERRGGESDPGATAHGAGAGAIRKLAALGPWYVAARGRGSARRADRPVVVLNLLARNSRRECIKRRAVVGTRLRTSQPPSVSPTQMARVAGTWRREGEP